MNKSSIFCGIHLYLARKNENSTKKTLDARSVLAERDELLSFDCSLLSNGELLLTARVPIFVCSMFTLSHKKKNKNKSLRKNADDSK